MIFKIELYLEKIVVDNVTILSEKEMRMLQKEQEKI